MIEEQYYYFIAITVSIILYANLILTVVAFGPEVQNMRDDEGFNHA